MANFNLRVASLNVWALPVLSMDTRVRMAAIARELAGLEVDIACLQEVWTGESREIILAEARAVGAFPHYAYFRAGARESGLLTLSRFPITETVFHRFGLSGRPDRLSDAEYLAGKGIGGARVQTPAGEVDVYDFHLIAHLASDTIDLYLAHRTAAAYEMVKFASARSRGRRPVLLLGDLNMTPDQLGYRILRCTGRFRDSYLDANPGSRGETRSGSNPYTPGIDPKRIDFIFSKDGAELALDTVESRVIMHEPPPPGGEDGPLAYSDHYGVLSDIELSERRSHGDEPEAECGPASEVRAEFLSIIEDALRIARLRQTGHMAGVMGGLVAAPTLYATGAALEAKPLRRRALLGRLLKAAAVAGVAPYTVLQGWLASYAVPDEIRELESVRDEWLLPGGPSDG